MNHISDFVSNNDYRVILGDRYFLRMRDLPRNERPREKLLKMGVENLTFEELISIVIGSGNRREEIRTFSKRIVKQYGEVSLMKERNPEVLSGVLNISLINAIKIIACGELGKRVYDPSKVGEIYLRNSKDTYDYLNHMKFLEKEELRCLYINTRHRLIHDEVISIGTVNSNVFHARDIFKPAIIHNAIGIILAHNHPSSDSDPSEEDISITKNLVEVGKVLGIPIIDHVIISSSSFNSIKIKYE